MALKSKIKKSERERLVNNLVYKLILEPTSAQELSNLYGYSKNFIGRVIRNDIRALNLEVKQDEKFRYYITF